MAMPKLNSFQVIRRKVFGDSKLGSSDLDSGQQLRAHAASQLRGAKAGIVFVSLFIARVYVEFTRAGKCPDFGDGAKPSELRWGLPRNHLLQLLRSAAEVGIQTM